MVPTPFEPIRPVGGPLDRDRYIARAEQSQPVHRRERPSSDEGSSSGGHGRHRDTEDDRADEIILVDAGMYDDHGRAGDADAGPHLDVSA